MNILRQILLTLIMSFVLFTPAVQVSAWSLTGGVDCDAHPESTACKVVSDDPTKNPLTGVDGILVKIAGIISYIAGAAAIILIVIASIRFMTSGGDSGRVKKARDSLLYALVGIAVIILARTLIFFVVNIYNK